jgi:hypothetical protein
MAWLLYMRKMLASLYPTAASSTALMRFEKCIGAFLRRAAQAPLRWRALLTLAQLVEIEARLPDDTVRRTANFYYLNTAGRIQRLSVYMRGG